MFAPVSLLSLLAKILGCLSLAIGLSQAEEGGPLPTAGGSGIIVSEIMYQPAPLDDTARAAGFADPSDFEFVELTHAGEESLSLTDLVLEGTVSFAFAQSTVQALEPGERIVLGRDMAALRWRYGEDLPVAGIYQGTLADDGGRLELRREGGPVELSFQYGRGPGWPETTRGKGFSLTLRNPTTLPNHDIPRSWRASALTDGSPGKADPEPPVLPVFIEEVRAVPLVLDTYYRVVPYPATPEEAPSSLVTALLNDMRAAAEPYRFHFLHLVGPDLTGHSYHWGSPQQDDAIRAVDVDLGEVLALVESDPRYRERTVILLTADHGGGGGLIYHHQHEAEPSNFTISFHAWGPGVPAGGDLYALNEETRTRPEPQANPAYSADTSTMPIRNGDLGNLALDILGLPSIPGSWINHDQTLRLGPEKVEAEYVIAISVDGLTPESVLRLGEANLPNLYRLRREGAYTDEARTDVAMTLTNPNHTSMLTSRGTLDVEGVGRGHQVTFNSSVSETLESWSGEYIASVFNVVKAAGGTSAFYSNKSKLDFLARSYGAIDGDAVELYNPNSVPVDVSGWGLSDHVSAPRRFSLPTGTVVPAGGYLVLREDPLWRSPRRPAPAASAYFGSAFSLEPDGGALHLFSVGNGKLTGFHHGLEYPSLPHGGVLVRREDLDRDRLAPSFRPSLGTENGAAWVGPLVITEVMAGAGRSFVELRNTGEEPIMLGPGWRLRGDLEFVFTEVQRVELGQFVVLAEEGGLGNSDVGTGALLFPGLQVSGGSEEMGARGITLALERLEGSVMGGARYATWESFTLGGNGAWETPSDGRSWERWEHRWRAASPLNWRPSQTAGGTPGEVDRGRYAFWAEEMLAGVETERRAPLADADGDGVSNWMEYGLAGDPLDPSEVGGIRLDARPQRDGLYRLRFRRPLGAIDLIFKPEVSSDLRNWRGRPVEVVRTESRFLSEASEVEETLFVALWAGAKYVRLRVE